MINTIVKAFVIISLFCPFAQAVVVTEMDEAVYVCPLDGKKSIYKKLKGADSRSKDNNYFYEVLALENSYKSRLAMLNGYAKDYAVFSLDSALFCRKHYPDLTRRFVTLVIQYKDGRTFRTDLNFYSKDAPSLYYSGSQVNALNYTSVALLALIDFFEKYYEDNKLSGQIKTLQSDSAVINKLLHIE